MTGFYTVYGMAIVWSSVVLATVLLYLAPPTPTMAGRNLVSMLLACAECTFVVGLIGGVSDVPSNAISNSLLPVEGCTIGMGRMRAASASTIATLEPVLAIELAWAFPGETLGTVQIAGTALVILAVLLLA